MSYVGGQEEVEPSSSEPHSHQILSGIQSVWVRNMNIPDRQIRNGNGWSCDGNISATNRSWELRLAERNIRYLRYWTLHPIPPRSANNLVKHWSFYNQQPLPPSPLRKLLDEALDISNSAWTQGVIGW